jgi:AcrR family transcriptional regulator
MGVRNTANKPLKREWNYGEVNMEDIVECARRFIQNHGVESLTMRRLAQELGMSSMVTYYYISSKQAILDEVIDLVHGEIPLPTVKGENFSDACREMMLNFRHEIIKYPGLVQVIQTRPLCPNSKRMRSLTDDFVRAYGHETIMRTGSFAIYQYALGAIAWEMQQRSEGPINEKRAEKRFLDGVNVILAGVIAQREASSSAKRRTRRA